MSPLAALSLLFFHAALVQSAKLPSYLKTCSRSDPEFNKCALKSGRELIPFIIPGDRSVRLPRLDPLTIERLEVNPTGNSRSAGLSLTCKNCDVIGLGQSELLDIKIDLDKKHIDLDLAIPKLSIVGKYEVTGRVLVLPITGNGDANITIPDLNIKLGLDFKLNKRKNQEYAQFNKYTVNFTTGRFYIHLTNLFGGDKLLGDNMNHFLNENWEEVHRDFSPAVSETIGQTIQLILNNIFEVIPYKSLIRN